MSRRETTMLCEAPKLKSFYSVFPDGTYYNIYDIQRNTRQEYQRLLIYTDTP